VLTDPDSNFLYADDQVGPEKKRAKFFWNPKDAENEKKKHGTLPNSDPKRWEDAFEKDLNPHDEDAEAVD